VRGIKVYLPRYIDFKEDGFSEEQVNVALCHPVMIKIYGTSDLSLAREILGRSTKSLREVAYSHGLRVFTLCSEFTHLFESLRRALDNKELQTVDIAGDGGMYLPLDAPVSSLGGVAVLGFTEVDALMSSSCLDGVSTSLNDVHAWCSSGHDVAELCDVTRACADNICVECARCHRHYGKPCEKVG